MHVVVATLWRLTRNVWNFSREKRNTEWATEELRNVGNRNTKPESGNYTELISKFHERFDGKYIKRLSYTPQVK